MTEQQNSDKCTCGLRKINGLCVNCDAVQPQENFKFARKKTVQDIRYEMYWLRTIADEYEDNTTPPDVGSTNSEG